MKYATGRGFYFATSSHYLGLLMQNTIVELDASNSRKSDFC